MKRKIFLSFRPEFFRLILYNLKMYEYRKKFCNEPTTAYLYLSSPVQEVIGIMELVLFFYDYEKKCLVKESIYELMKNSEKLKYTLEPKNG